MGWDLPNYVQSHPFANVALGSEKRQAACEIIEPFILLAERADDPRCMAGMESLCLYADA